MEEHLINWRNQAQAPQFQTILQSYSNQDWNKYGTGTKTEIQINGTG